MAQDAEPMATEQPSPAERKAPRRPPETSKNTGWWAAMIVISRDGAASELDRVFQVADRPNPNYRLQVHEGLREVRRRRGGARGGGARGARAPLRGRTRCGARASLSVSPRSGRDSRCSTTRSGAATATACDRATRRAISTRSAAKGASRAHHEALGLVRVCVCVTRILFPRGSADPSLADVLGRTPADMDAEMRFGYPIREVDQMASCSEGFFQSWLSCNGL